MTKRISGNQRLFNKVVRHLRRQGQAATSELGCVYRGSDGLECAVGCLIPNKLYRPGMERKGIDALFGLYPKVKEHLDRLYDEPDSDFLIDLQEIHDYNLRKYGVQSMETEFKRFANKYNVKLPK